MLPTSCKAVQRVIVTKTNDINTSKHNELYFLKIENGIKDFLETKRKNITKITANIENWERVLNNNAYPLLWFEWKANKFDTFESRLFFSTIPNRKTIVSLFKMFEMKPLMLSVDF